MKTAIKFLFFCSGMLFISCGGTKYNPDTDPVTMMYDSIGKADSLKRWGPATEIDFSRAGDTASLDGSRITITGFIGIGTSISMYDSHTYIDLWERQGQFRGENLSVGIDIGDSLNQMANLPDTFKVTDLEIKDLNGQLIRYGDKVKITGMYAKPSYGTYGSVDVQTIEKLPDTEFEFPKSKATEITTDTAGYAALEGKLVAAEGFAEVPVLLSTSETTYFFLKPQKNAADYITIDLIIGSGPNRVPDFPDNYTEQDVKILDHKGNPVSNKKIRVFGTMSYGRIAVEYVESL